MGLQGRLQKGKWENNRSPGAFGTVTKEKVGLEPYLWDFRDGYKRESGKITVLLELLERLQKEKWENNRPCEVFGTVIKEKVGK